MLDSHLFDLIISLVQFFLIRPHFLISSVLQLLVPLPFHVEQLFKLSVLDLKVEIHRFITCLRERLHEVIVGGPE
jgi:hypothetical protein